MTPNITPTTSSADLLESTREAWQDIAVRKRATRDSLIPRQWRLPEHLALSISQGGPRDVLDIPSRSGIMTEEELKMTEMDGAELLISLAQSKIKSRTITTSFCKRAAIAQQLASRDAVRHRDVVPLY